MKNRIEMIKQAAYIDELQKIAAFKFPFKKIKSITQTPKSVGENEISVLVPGKGFVKSENIKHAAYIDELQKIASKIKDFNFYDKAEKRYKMKAIKETNFGKVSKYLSKANFLFNKKWDIVEKEKEKQESRFKLKKIKL